MKMLPQGFGWQTAPFLRRNAYQLLWVIRVRFRATLGGIAQLGERLICIQEVIGSIPFTSTILNEGV